VEEDDVPGVVHQRHLDDLLRIDDTPFEGARCDEVTADRKIALAQEKAPDLFVVQRAQDRV